jgi:hypothetical protein
MKFDPTYTIHEPNMSYRDVERHWDALLILFTEKAHQWGFKESRSLNVHGEEYHYTGIGNGEMLKISIEAIHRRDEKLKPEYATLTMSHDGKDYEVLEDIVNAIKHL